MELHCKHFDALTTKELWQIYRLRSAVFVVEQACVYQDIDTFDLQAYHLFLTQGDEMLAYARALPAGTAFDTPSIGRVIAVRRRCGLGTKIVAAALQAAVDKFGAQTVTIEAQTYARALYEKLGFRQTSEEFLEDGIPHIRMEWRAQ